MTSDWYFAKAGAPAGSETGPFEWEQLYQLAKNGTVQPDDLVWNPKLPRGVAARLVPGLFLGLESSEAPVQQVWVEETPEPPAPAPVATPLDVEESEPAAEEAPVVEQPPETAVPDDLGELTSEEEIAEEPEAQSDERSQRAKANGQGNRLALFVVLVTFIIAAAGVAAYFLYFRV